MTTSRGNTTAKKKPGYRPAVARVLTSLFEANEHIREGSMFGHPAFYASGKLFACAYGQGVSLKLPANRVKSIERERHVFPFQPYGRPRMREWVMLNRPRAADYEKDLPLFEEAIAFVAGITRGGPPKRKRRS
jgi:hypothetical protein